jgi:hypothetical protein
MTGWWLMKQSAVPTTGKKLSSSPSVQPDDRGHPATLYKKHHGQCGRGIKLTMHFHPLGWLQLFIEWTMTPYMYLTFNQHKHWNKNHFVMHPYNCHKKMGEGVKVTRASARVCARACVCVCVCARAQAQARSNLDPSIPVGDDPGPPISFFLTILVFHFETCCTALGSFTYTIHVGSPCSS